ncbi:hypothetical protein CFN78_27545 [Amycolatopsis antarctica]|uniref:Knr4/Smi1-like domain-containing protein n=1 Tax=Amycolatopsis antarctica TaxID=1854586 RepID=A0A263CV90_9PSEU|nr:SMI1/KNR4 family protein [Amycolatopsis antarctica]OZM70021.1 hypothetical protein CFN78_27545 [Amycolatopsis antarctica]
MPEPWNPESYLETLVSEVLSGSGEQRAGAVAGAALLLACTGFTAESDALAETWAEHDGAPPPEAAAHALAHRAWAMLWAARGGAPGWAESVVPLDLDAEERKHRERLAGDRWSTPRAAGPVTELAGLDLLRSGLDDARGGSALPALEALERFLSGPDAAKAAGRTAVAESAALAAELAAAAGERDRALGLLGDLVGEAAGAGRLPDLLTLAGCRHLAPLFVEGAIAGPLGMNGQWADRYSGELRAALHARLSVGHVPEHGELDWPGLVDAVLTARGGPDLPTVTAPPPATAAELHACESRLGVRLPEDHRTFLRTANGLPADFAFPELLGTGGLAPLSTAGSAARSTARSTSDDPGSVELIRRALPDGAAERAIQVSTMSDLGVLLLVPSTDGWAAWEFDWTLGITVHPSFRDLLASHLSLLRRLA